MRVRCSRGLRVSSFHGPMFVRSTDLLALPQVRCFCYLEHKTKWSALVRTLDVLLRPYGRALHRPAGAAPCAH